jgi:hypothetical protein
MTQPIPKQTSNRPVFIILGVLLALVIVGVVFAYVVPSTPARVVTMDGMDKASGTVIDPINVWGNYQTRTSVVAHVRSGDKVKLISRNGDGVQIETDNGTRGWVTYWFIKELQ